VNNEETMNKRAERVFPSPCFIQDIDGRNLNLSKYKGKVVLVVNVASQCGFTPQYKELGRLYDTYSSQGLVVIGAPCNQFGSQEPGSNADIKQFAQQRGAKFPLLSKLDVNGPNESPLYSWLKKEKGGILISDVKWNFTKFLIDREGNVVGRYFSTTSPSDIEKDVLKYL
jgi:glutathione peroxidase